MRKQYQGRVSLDQAGISFVDDIDAFAASIGRVDDDRPTIVLAMPEGADEVSAAIGAWLDDAN